MSFIDKIEQFAGSMFTAEPELVNIVRDFRQGVITEKEAMKRVYGLSARHPEFQKAVESEMFKAFELDSHSTSLAKFPARENLLERWGFEEEDLAYKPFPDRPNYAMMHPLLMGMIAELLQFDGDIPELRTGKLPEGGSPAVPVLTESRDPVMIGALLKEASQEVASELMLARSEHEANVGELAEAMGAEGANSLPMKLESERGVAVQGYAPGQKAQMRRVEPPSSIDVARMPFKERQELAHKALTSTQGRRSAVPVISTMVLDSLHSEGYAGVRLGEDGTAVAAEAEWIIMIDGGKGERNPNFNFIDTAARSISAKLRRSLAGQSSRYTPLRLSIKPVNNISDRRVGWRATLFE
jgi:hypothetical protein